MNETDIFSDSTDLYFLVQQFIEQEQEKIQNCGKEQDKKPKEDGNFDKSIVYDKIRHFISPLPFIGGYDKMEVYKSLSNHFNLTGQRIQKYINKQIDLLTNLKTELFELENQNLHSSTVILTRFNSKFWRVYLFTLLKYAKYKFKYLHILIPKIEKNIKILKKLKHLADKLRIKPLIAFFIYDSIHNLTNSDVTYRLYFKLESIKKALDDLNYAITFFPINFTKETSKDFLNLIINSSQKFIDPLTGYLKESDEYLNFEDYITSPYSPLVGVIQLEELEIEEQIRSSCKILRSFAGITNKIHISILGSFCMRYWINKSFSHNKLGKNKIKNYINKNINEKDISFLFSNCQGLKLSDLSPPSKIGKIFNLNSNIIDFFKSSNAQILSPSPNLLFSCIFMTNPCDIANAISQINLRLSAYVASLTGTDLDDEIVHIGSEFLWKLVFIYSCVPGIDAVFNFAHFWENYQYSPKELFKSIQVPSKALNSLIKEFHKFL